MKIITLDGHVGTNGTEIKTTKTGKPYARFSLANNTFSNGETKTEWYDVITYDPLFIEKRAQYCGKGCYVIITGDIRTEVKVDQNNKMWINHYIKAVTIDTPRLNKTENPTQNPTQTTIPEVSTFTGGTKSEFTSEVKAQPQSIPNVQVVGAASNMPQNIGMDINDDLPF